MRKVHTVCYYCAEEFWDEEDLYRRCALKHLRKTPAAVESQPPTLVIQEIDSKDENSGKQEVSTEKKEEEKPKEKPQQQIDEGVCQVFDSKLAKFMKQLEDAEDFTGSKIVEQKTEDFLTKNVVRHNETVFECAVCTKKFMADHFVKKHITAKHPEKVETVQSKALEGQFLRNFFNDVKRSAYIQSWLDIPSRLIRDKEDKEKRPQKFNDRWEKSKGDYSNRPPSRSDKQPFKPPPKFSGATPTNVRPDPRPLRSYHDLDFPEEETEVKIDFE
jgi:hypothetical protein